MCGDVHGQFYDLLNIFKLNGKPSEQNPYLFNGEEPRNLSCVLCIQVTLTCSLYIVPAHLHFTVQPSASRSKL